VKGVLAEEFRNRPHATSSDRVADHYLAYMAAQRFIASAPEAAATAQRR